MIETKRTKPRKKNIVVDFIKALSEKSAKEFSMDIKTGELYRQLSGKNKKK